MSLSCNVMFNWNKQLSWVICKRYFMCSGIRYFWMSSNDLL